MGETDTSLLLRLLEAATSAMGCWPAIKSSMEDAGVTAEDIERLAKIADREGFDPPIAAEDFE